VPRAFATRVDEFLAEFFRLLPVHATSAGHHEHDHRWPDLTDAGRAERIAFLDAWDQAFRAMGDDSLTAGERLDRDLLLQEIDALRFDEVDLATERWDPLEWVYLLGGGLFPLLAREFAPLPVRLASATGRIEGIPGLVQAAKGQLTGLEDRPVSRLHAETALKQLPGIIELVDDAVTAAADGPADEAIDALRPRLQQAAATARAAIGELETHLREVVLPRSDGEGRLGAELFAGKLLRTLRNADLTPARVLERAERDYSVVRAELVRLARDQWSTWRPDQPVPAVETAGSADAADDAIVRGVLDAIAAEHQRAPDLLDFCRRELQRVEAFCRDGDLIGLAEDPLEIRWTPVYLRAFGGAMLDSPGPLDRGQKAFFSITPIPDDWTPEQAESYLREDNDRMLRLLTIHEAVPGHYLQGVYANRHPSIVRSIFWSGVFAEGWAVYVTQVMMDEGYGADDPALLLTHWKFYLRAITNAIIDIRIHTLGMSEDEAVRLMVDGGFQEEAEARNKYSRARLTATQLSTYYVGSLEFWDLEHETRRRAAVTSGDPRAADAVALPRLVGGYGQTPGFVYRHHLEACISQGSPPMPLLRRILLG